MRSRWFTCYAAKRAAHSRLEHRSSTTRFSPVVDGSCSLSVCFQALALTWLEVCPARIPQTQGPESVITCLQSHCVSWPAFKSRPTTTWNGQDVQHLYGQRTILIVPRPYMLEFSGARLTRFQVMMPDFLHGIRTLVTIVQLWARS
jgi:hypothetical protein